MANVQSANTASQSLAQLQAEWRNHGKQPHDDYYAGVWDSLMDCANSLQPHVEREAKYEAVVKAAQAVCGEAIYANTHLWPLRDQLQAALAALSSEEK